MIQQIRLPRRCDYERQVVHLWTNGHFNSNEIAKLTGLKEPKVVSIMQRFLHTVQHNIKQPV